MTLARSKSREQMFNMGRVQVHSRLSSVENISAGSLNRGYNTAGIQ